MAYQSILFSRTKDADQYNYYIRDDKLGIKKFKYWPTLYKLDEEGDHTTLFGDKCSAIEGKHDKDDQSILERDISKELVCLRDLYYESDEVPSFHNIIYLDIEIEMLGALTPDTIRAAEAEITAIAVTDIKTMDKFCYILDKKQNITNSHIENKYLISCSSEKDLMKKFLYKWQELDPTIVVHFNGDYFDIPYLFYRIKRILGNEVYRLSPIGKIEENIYNPQSPIKIGLVNSLDYMLLFKKYITKEEPSYKLGDLGEKYVNLGKIEYEGNLNTLFKTDPLKFAEYNFRDVDIIEALDKKFGFVDLTIQIAHLCHAPYESIYYNTVLNEGAILSFLKRKGIVSPNKPTTTNPSIKDLSIDDLVVNQRGTPSIEGIIHSINGTQVTVKKTSGAFITRDIRTVKKKEGYKGGYLLDPKPGLYSWLSDFDYSSFYPSCIRSLNLGIETFVARIVIPNPTKELWYSLEELKELDPKSSIKLEKLKKSTYTFTETELTVGELIKYIEDNKWNITANGAIYRTDKISVVAEILTEWFNMRTLYKEQMGEAFEKGDMELYAFMDRKQQAFKILLNAMYGAFAINSFRYTDGFKIISSSITCSCQRLLQQSIKYANEMIETDYLN